jgi:hypothetical protein
LSRFDRTVIVTHLGNRNAHQAAIKPDCKLRMVR